MTIGGSSTFDVNNTGPAVKLTPTGGPGWTVQWSGETGTPQTGTLQEFHVHVPAEHQDAGRYHAGEIHFVYALPGNRRLALTAWIDHGGVNQVLDKIIRRKPGACGGTLPLNETLTLQQFNVDWRRYAAYRGSLTTPPCDENVTFLIALTPIFATPGQLDQLKLVRTLLGNTRPIQLIKVSVP